MSRATALQWAGATPGQDPAAASVDATSPAVSPVLVRRTAGLPHANVAQLRDATLLKSLQDSSDADRSAQLAVVRSSNALAALVPGATKQDRGVLLRMRRDLHNMRVPGQGDLATLARVCEAQSSSDAAPTVAAAVGAVVAVELARDAVTDALQEACASASDVLLGALGDPSLARGIPLASPHATDALRGATAADLASPEARLSRTALAYVVRAGLKPGPLTTFTRLRADAVSTAHPALIASVRAAAEAARPVVQLAAAVPLSLLHAALAEPTSRGGLRLRANASDREMPAGRRLLVPMYQHLQEQFFWRRDDVVDADEVAEALDALRRACGHDRGRGLPASEVLAALPPGWTARRALDCALVVAVAPWTDQDADPLARLAQALEAGGTPRSLDASRHVWSASRCLTRAASYDASRRRGMHDEVIDHVRGAFRALGAPVPAHVSARDLVHEDVPGPPAAEPVPAGVQAGAEHLARVLAPRLFRSTLVDEVVRAVRTVTGVAHGRVRVEDVMGLLHAISHGADAVVRFQRAAMADARFVEALEDPSEAAAQRPVARTATTTPPQAFVVLQQADEAAGAGLSLVVDQVGLAGPGSLTRFRDVLGLPALSDVLAERLRRVTRGRLLEVVVAADQNALQRRAAGLLPRLDWPVESVDPSKHGSVLVDELTLVVEPDDQVLLVDRSGTPVVLVYAGVVPVELISGPVRNLLALCSPWALAHRSAERPEEARLAEAPPATLQHSSRVADGPLVLQRATWRVAPADCPLAEAGVPLAQLARRYDRWRRDHGLPAECYLRVSVRNRGFAAAPKPLWFAVDAPHALAAARRAASRPDVNVLRLVEALPSTRDVSTVLDPTGRVWQHAALLDLWSDGSWT